MIKKINQLSDPLNAAQSMLKSTRWQIWAAMAIPLPMVGLGLWLVDQMDQQYTWYKDPLLALIMGFFIATQLITMYQLATLVRGTKRSDKVIETLRGAWGHGVQTTLQALQKAPSCHLRDALYLWVQQVQLGDLESFESLQDRQHDRRGEIAAKKVGLHIALNRASLKLGFIGTLIGLLLTFEPMKDALITLQKDDGELGFISDIARAIDGDQYAILATLIASALSVIVETVNMQWLERILAKFELMNNHMEEWSLTVLLPWARSQAVDLQGDEVLALQKQMNENLRLLKDAAAQTQAELHHLVELQSETSQRLQTMSKQEEAFKQFLRSKAGLES